MSDVLLNKDTTCEADVIEDFSNTAVSGNAWDVLESLIGKVEGPEDWSEQHDHYLYGTPKH